jgi:2-polyprenyl-3-methyl-5-hydroxy-6-metoxy-1,4-benzoquinol methylase
MSENLDSEAVAVDPAALYGPEYGAPDSTRVLYAHRDHWRLFFGNVADALVRSFAPRRVFDAGCAIGLLVEALWDRGVKTNGRDVSSWAVGQVRADVRPWCKVGSISDPVDDEYDLIICIGVLERLSESEAVRAVRALAAATPRILFSPPLTDLGETPHTNLRPSAYWLALWAEAGFAPSVTHDASYLAPHAYILEHSEEGRSERERVAFANLLRHRVELFRVGAAMHTAEARLAETEREKTAVQTALATAEARLANSEVLVRALAAGAAARNSAIITRPEHQRIIGSTAWRPATILRRRARQGLRVIWWTVTLQLAARLRARRNSASGGLRLSANANDGGALAPVNAVDDGESSVDALQARRFLDLSALPVFAAPRADRRFLTLVTDSIGVGSLYGGVGTALILAALAARRIGVNLRVVTRTERPVFANVGAVLDAHGIPWDRNIEFVYAARDGASGSRDVPVATDDFFLTTSWWTTWSTRRSVPRARIAYLLQEDERMFYPLGDDHLRCSETLSDPDLLYLVNSELLLAHLHDEGLAPGATAFEPSFPERLYCPVAPDVRRASDKRNFFFYARPNNVRNLYWRGLDVLCAAIEEGVLDPAEWDFHFAGHGAHKVSLPRGGCPLFSGPMAWKDYAAFIRRMDVGLSLMYTPHPSYPPLDLAASGAVVVTNRFGRKHDLDRYSPNILCADLDVPSLVAAIRAATVIATDSRARSANFANNSLQRDWAVSMAPALDRLAAWARA